MKTKIDKWIKDTLMQSFEKRDKTLSVSHFFLQRQLSENIIINVQCDYYTRSNGFFQISGGIEIFEQSINIPDGIISDSFPFYITNFDDRLNYVIILIQNTLTPILLELTSINMENLVGSKK